MVWLTVFAVALLTSMSYILSTVMIGCFGFTYGIAKKSLRTAGMVWSACLVKSHILEFQHCYIDFRICMEEGKLSKKDIKIVIAAHKPYRMPEDTMYVPLHVGAEGKKNPDGTPLDLGYQKDNEGDNISAKNPYYCELTGIYYAWKNIPAEYLGLVHYRRYFKGKNKSKDPFACIVTEPEMEKIFETHRIVVPKKRKYYIETLYSHYAHTHYAEHLDCVREIIGEQCPDYLNSYDKVIKQTSGYMFNMMVMERALFDSYCAWLFAILFELEKRVGEKQPEIQHFRAVFMDG